MLRDAETGPRRVDKVVKVRTLADQPLYLVLHVEIQAERETGFPQRMFIYYYRLYDRKSLPPPPKTYFAT